MRLKVVYTVHERNPDGSYGQSTTHVARTASGVSRPAGAAEQGSNKDSSETATTFLKSCLALICYTRPDLIPDVNTDYSVSVLDIAESAAGNGRVFEGQGMMGWILAEQNSGTTCIAGKLQKGTPLHHDNNNNNVDPSLDDGDVLEVVLELKPRKPIPRKDFLSTLSSSSKATTPQTQAQPTPAPEAPTPAPSQSMTLPNGSTIDSTAMLAMLQTLFTAAAAGSNQSSSTEASSESAESQARQFVNTLGANMPLLPGINLFNPIQAKAVQLQQQQSAAASSSSPAASTQAFPLAKLRASKTKPPALSLHSSHGSTSSNGAPHHPMSESNVDMGNFSFPGKGKGGNGNGRSQTANGHQFASRSVNNAASASAAHPASEPMHQHAYQNQHHYHQQLQQQQQHEPYVRLKYWARGCLQCGKTESKQWRVKQKRKKALDGTDLDPKLIPEDGSISKLCEECAQKLPSKQMKKKRKAEIQDEAEVPALNPAYRAILPNTSPVRRSPRRHQSSSLNRSALLSAQPLTSPTGLGSRGSSASSFGNGGTAGKRRKFTTALSAAALREENKTAEGLTPDEGSFLAPIPQFKPQINGKDAVFNLNDNNVTLQQAKEVFGNTSTNGTTGSSNFVPPAIDGMISHEDESFNFFLNASPGTIMRSFNIMSPKKNNATPTNDPPSAATIRAFPNLGLSPLQSRILASDAQGTSAVFSPLGSSLSTPFRALLNPGSTKGRERATSEQPPASHSRLMQELELRDAPEGQNQQILNVPAQNGVPQFLSSDDNLLGSASNVQINLLPATADRRQGAKVEGAVNDQLLSDSMMNDFNAFLLNSSNGLFSPTPFIPKPENAGKPALAPLTLAHDAIKQQSLSPLAMLSSEMDIDLSNLPPSSPPPLPGTSMGQHASTNSLANVQAFWSNFNSGFSNNNGGYLASNKNAMQGGQQLDDGQSPISVSTTVTQGGTPQDMPISHDTGPSEPGHSVAEDRSNAGQTGMPYTRPNKAGTSSNVDSPLSLIDTDSIQDPLFEYFSFMNDSNGSSAHNYVSHNRQSSASSVSSAFLERLKKSTSGQGNSVVTRSSSSSMAMTWSDSTASVSSLASLPVTDLTARSKTLQKQKALEEAKRTNVPIDSAVLENTIDALLDLDD